MFFWLKTEHINLHVQGYQKPIPEELWILHHLELVLLVRKEQAPIHEKIKIHFKHMVIFFGSSSSSCRDENLIQVKVATLIERLTDWFTDLHNVQYCSKVSYHTLARCESRHVLFDSCKVHVNSLLMKSSRKISWRILKIT